MARPTIDNCRECGRHVDECGSLSVTSRRCRDCWKKAAAENLDQLHAHKGPRFDYYVARMRAAFGVSVPGVTFDND